jgi:hypothetical protein
MTSTEFHLHHKHTLESQMILLKPLKKRITCLACLMNFPDEVLQCSHTLCSSCCKELLVDGTVACPFCNQHCEWECEEIPDGAGYRILSLSATHKNTLMPALLLHKIEDQTGIPVNQLFDFIAAEDAAVLSVGRNHKKKTKEPRK